MRDHAAISHVRASKGRSALALVVALIVSGCSGALTAVPDEHVEQAAGVGSDQQPSGEPFNFPDLDGLVLEQLDPVDTVDPAGEVIAGWTLEEKVASLFMIHVPGTQMANFQTVIDTVPVGGFLLLGDNISGTVDQAQPLVTSLRTMADSDLLIAIDQEGGAVQRLRPDELLSASELAVEDVAVTTEVTRERNRLVFDVGANMNLGVVADVSPGEDAYIHSRSFGSEPREVSARVKAALQGSIDGVAVAVKHFPGHGLTVEDTHETLGVAEEDVDQWGQNHAIPFQTAVDEQVPVLMLGHLVMDDVDDQPASLSSQWVQLLRDQWGYQGVIVTDDLSMLESSGDSRFADSNQNAASAFAAGVDMVIDSGGLTARQTLTRLTGMVDEVVAAVERDEISQTQIDQAALRVLRLRESLGGVARPLEDAESGELDG